MDPQVGDFHSADVLIDGQLISAIAPRLEVADAVDVDMSDHLVMPGFIDSHRHLWEGLLRSSLPDADLQQYFQQVLGVYGPCYEPDDVYAGSLVSALGALNAGVTTVLDWSHIQNTPAHTDSAIAALRDSKLRAVFAFGPPSRGFTPWWEDSGHCYPEDLRRLRKGPLSSDTARVTLALAALGPEFMDDATTEREWRIADEFGLRIAVHVGVGTAGQQGRLAQFAHHYPLNDRTTYIHCCTLSDDEWKMIADTGGAVSLSPQIDLQMGQGTPPVQTALDHGLQPSLSVDVETSAPCDMFTQMRSAFAIQRGTSFQQFLEHGREPRLVTSREIVRFATLEGARANGLASVTGSLTPGKQADLICLRTDSINVLPVNDAYGAVVTGMDTSNVAAVMVAGEFVKWQGELLHIDMRSLRCDVERARDRVMARAKPNVARDPGASHSHSHSHSH